MRYQFPRLWIGQAEKIWTRVFGFWLRKRLEKSSLERSITLGPTLAIIGMESSLFKGA